MASKLDVPLHRSSINVVKQCGPVLIDVLQSKFGCVAKIHGVDLNIDPSFAQFQKPTIQAEERFVAVLRAGVRVSVWKADLTNFPVDAVVNAANTRLQHYGGLALALSDAGGPEIQRESSKYVDLNGDLKTGDVVVTNAGSLLCNKIIHAVGPQLPSSPSDREVSQAKPLLQNAVWHILDVVDKHHLQSVAIPALSSGLFHFPLQLCAETIVSSMKQYYEYKTSGHLPLDIFLANHDEPTVMAMETACRQILASQSHQPMSFSQAASASKGRGAARDSRCTVQLGNIRLTLKKGRIEEQQADVIVNTTMSGGDLSTGQISFALLKKAGRKMQDEFGRSHSHRYVIITKGYNLQCKQVYHTLCAESKWSTAKKILFEAVSQCLELAVLNHHKSIAFPAIGTGNLGIRKEDAAKVMSEAMATFAQKATDMLDVNLIIFPGDTDKFKAFEQELRSLQHRSSHPSSSQGFEQRPDHGSRASTPQISLSSESDESTREAERWLSSLLNYSYETIIVCNNFIQHFGKKEFLQLSRETKRDVIIDEFLSEGRAGIMIKGNSVEDVVVVAVQVEAMLCNIQREFVREEECIMRQVSRNATSERKTIDQYDPLFADRKSDFNAQGLQTVRVDRVENPALKEMFDLKRKQLQSSFPSRTMYQRIPAQFCGMVSQIGFHAEYAPPDDPAYGDGIYFAGNVNTAMKVWRELAEEEYLYFVEAAVLTGKSTPGKPDLIVPPAVGEDPLRLYDSVSGGPDISVIFSGYQALPQYIVICRKY
ncbi:hypothetical protein LDENG_00274160 [Lucifuga dentata]|nr:hypothetical protein LDENG_00274160 [Lucifuga dentata]